MFSLNGNSSAFPRLLFVLLISVSPGKINLFGCSCCFSERKEKRLLISPFESFPILVQRFPSRIFQSKSTSLRGDAEQDWDGTERVIFEHLPLSGWKGLRAAGLKLFTRAAERISGLR